MNIVRHLFEVQPEMPMVWALGFFDGCHLGHQKVLETACRLGKEKKGAWGIITFEPHPLTVLRPDLPLDILQPQKEKLNYFKMRGASHVILLKPTEDFLGESVGQFLKELQGLPNLAGLVSGENFTFGKEAKGNTKDLQAFFADTPVAVETVPLLYTKESGTKPVSSSLIRECIQQGDMERTTALLGCPYQMVGVVVAGFDRGKSKLGYPTANIERSKGQVVPADGVYVTRAIVEGRFYNSVTNVGRNPTFGNEMRSIETFLMDFDGDIYGKLFRIEFLKKLRNEKKFSSPTALQSQIQQDVENAKTVW